MHYSDILLNVNLISKYANCAHNIPFSTYMFPPRSLELRVTTIEPIQTITKTSANSGPPSFELSAVSAEPCNILQEYDSPIIRPNRKLQSILKALTIATVNSRL
jgi:hypothetical protein